MTLNQAIETYVTLKHSLGAVFSSDCRILRSFGRTLGDIPVDSISPQACHTFCRGSGPATRWWERKHTSLRGLFTYLVARGQLVVSPLLEPSPCSTRTFEPYVYSREEVKRLLDATAILVDANWPLKQSTFRTLLLVLYGAGLRPSEALRLRCCDVDRGDRVLAIWDTKFFKSRLVPIGVDLARALETYRRARQRLSMPGEFCSAFFAPRMGKSISLSSFEAAFAQLREHTGIRRPPEARWQPRLHDLRHAFAVHRLIAWYREGADVQACLPLLATYLGHINLSGTQPYLTMTPELLDEASRRFEHYAAIAKEEQHA